jgi:protein-tyrosine-phosphatase
MTPPYQQSSPERCVTSMKKSGKLAVALLFVALGAVLLLFGSRAGKDSDTGTPDPPVTSTCTAEEYRAELESRMEAICADVAGVGEVDVVVTMGCNVRCPFLPCSHREDWGLEDPSGKPDEAFLETIRIIGEKVLDLRERLK